eukprot:Skav210852  [mRNA]  locus=scaffold2829:160784:163128:- [translate_table: standard]
MCVTCGRAEAPEIRQVAEDLMEEKREQWGHVPWDKALVLLKAGHYEDAAAAAEEALQLNSQNSKAAFRQAQATGHSGGGCGLPHGCHRDAM